MYVYAHTYILSTYIHTYVYIQCMYALVCSLLQIGDPGINSESKKSIDGRTLVCL